MILLCLALLAAGTEEPAPEPAPVVFQGNVVLPDGIYLAALDLPRGTKASVLLARTVLRKLRTFLKRGGYDLSVVSTRFENDLVEVEIDEGRLDKIVFLGEGLLGAIRLKLELDLPGRVFNRDLVERKLRALATKLGIEGFRWELVLVESAPPPKAQLDDLEPLRGLPFLQPGRPYELRIFVSKQEEGGTGWWPEIEIDSLEGGGLGAGYHAGHGLTLAGRVAAAFRNHLDRPGSSAVLSRAWFEASYRGLLLFGDRGPQPIFTARVDFLDRQRADLQLEQYDQFEATVSAAVEQPLGPHLTVGVGLGARRRWLFALRAVAPVPPIADATPKAEHRVFGGLAVRLDLDPGELRLDRHAVVAFTARLFPSIQTDHQAAAYLNLRGTGMRPVGWHELWFRGGGTSLMGEVPFSDEDSLGSWVHGPFGGNFARKIATAGGEWRYSLLRDLFKLGPYLEGITYGEINRTTDRETLRVGAVGGVVMSGLVLDQFLFEFYAGMGVLSEGQTGGGIALAVRQAY